MRLLPAALLATAVAATDLEPRNFHCAKGVHVIALGGQGTTTGDLGYLKTLVTNITHRIPHSNYEQIGYPKGATPPEILAYAQPKLRKRLHNYRKKCPHTKIVLASYSMGASATMNVLCGNSSTGAGDLPASYLKNIMANVVYGDVTFVPGQFYDRGTCTQSTGLAPRQHPEKCRPFGRKTRSFCDYNDVNCCSGNDEAVHFSYPGIYDVKASQHVHARWRNHQQWLRKHRHGKHHHKHHGKKHHHKKHHHRGGKN